MNTVQAQFEQLPDAWREMLSSFIQHPDYLKLLNFLDQRKHAVIYPPRVFSALELTTPEAVKVIILGQDPYHGEQQANGLAFSVAPNIRIPPSLRNIYQEIEQNFSHPMPKHGCLESWAKQGVLLLNTILTVEKSKPGSHAKRGWETCTEIILRVLAQQNTHLVVMLWGAHAQAKKPLFHSSHLILEAPHPSPLSAYRGFLGCKHFLQANAYLTAHQLKPIDWSLPMQVKQADSYITT